MKNETVLAVGFGLGGHHEDYLPKPGYGRCHLSGYDSPEGWSPDEGVDYTRAVVIDKRAAVEKNHGLAYRSPLLDVTSKGIEKFPLDLVGCGMSEAIAEQNPTYALCATLHATTPPEEPGPFDSVDIATYTAWWKSHGARIGSVNSQGRIVWEDGEIQSRRQTPAQMAESIGVTLEEYYQWGDLFRISRDGQVLKEGINRYGLHRELVALGAAEMDQPA